MVHGQHNEKVTLRAILFSVLMNLMEHMSQMYYYYLLKWCTHRI
jgi:hypothetical protein